MNTPPAYVSYRLGLLITQAGTTLGLSVGHHNTMFIAFLLVSSVECASVSRFLFVYLPAIGFNVKRHDSTNTQDFNDSDDSSTAMTHAFLINFTTVAS